MPLLQDGQVIRDTYEVERFLATLGIDKKRFLTVAKRQVGLPALDAASGSKGPRPRWN
jgi:hypothetical protein